MDSTINPNSRQLSLVRPPQLAAVGAIVIITGIALLALATHWSGFKGISSYMLHEGRPLMIGLGSGLVVSFTVFTIATVLSCRLTKKRREFIETPKKRLSLEEEEPQTPPKLFSVNSNETQSEKSDTSDSDETSKSSSESDEPQNISKKSEPPEKPRIPSRPSSLQKQDPSSDEKTESLTEGTESLSGDEKLLLKESPTNRFPIEEYRDSEEEQLLIGLIQELENEMSGVLEDEQPNVASLQENTTGKSNQSNTSILTEEQLLKKLDQKSELIEPASSNTPNNPIQFDWIRDILLEKVKTAAIIFLSNLLTLSNKKEKIPEITNAITVILDWINSVASDNKTLIKFVLQKFRQNGYNIACESGQKILIGNFLANFKNESPILEIDSDSKPVSSFKELLAVLHNKLTSSKTPVNLFFADIFSKTFIDKVNRNRFPTYTEWFDLLVQGFNGEVKNGSYNFDSFISLCEDEIRNMDNKAISSLASTLKGRATSQPFLTPEKSSSDISSRLKKLFNAFHEKLQATDDHLEIFLLNVFTQTIYVRNFHEQLPVKYKESLLKLLAAFEKVQWEGGTVDFKPLIEICFQEIDSLDSQVIDCLIERPKQNFFSTNNLLKEIYKIFSLFKRDDFSLDNPQLNKYIPEIKPTDNFFSKGIKKVQSGTIKAVSSVGGSKIIDKVLNKPIFKYYTENNPTLSNALRIVIGVLFPIALMAKTEPSSPARKIADELLPLLKNTNISLVNRDNLQKFLLDFVARISVIGTETATP